VAHSPTQWWSVGHSERFIPEKRLIIVTLEGTITWEEEVQTLLDTVRDPRMMQDARFFVDRRDSRMTATPDTVEPLMGLVQQHLKEFGSPRIAIVVSDDYGFGMNRMLEQNSESELPHDFAVFRTAEEAAA